LAHEAGQAAAAGEKAYQAMLNAAKALVGLVFRRIQRSEQIVAEFRTRYFDTQKFFDPFAGGKFANYPFDARTSWPAVHVRIQPVSDRMRRSFSLTRRTVAHNRLGTLVTA
jgi:hypothetical protein